MSLHQASGRTLWSLGEGSATIGRSTILIGSTLMSSGPGGAGGGGGGGGGGGSSLFDCCPGLIHACHGVSATRADNSAARSAAETTRGTMKPVLRRRRTTGVKSSSLNMLSSASSRTND